MKKFNEECNLAVQQLSNEAKGINDRVEYAKAIGKMQGIRIAQDFAHNYIHMGIRSVRWVFIGASLQASLSSFMDYASLNRVSADQQLWAGIGAFCFALVFDYIEKHLS